MKHNKNKRIFVFAAAMILSLTLFSGCKNDAIESETTLQQIMEEKGQEKIEQVKTKMEDAFLPTLGEGGSVEISVKKNEIILNLTYGNDVLTDVVRESLGQNLDAMQQIFLYTAQNIKDSLELDRDVILTANCLDATGELLETRTFQAISSIANPPKG